MNRKILSYLIILSFFLGNCSQPSPEKKINQQALDKLFSTIDFNNPNPQIFAFGKVSSMDQEHSSLAFSPDGTEIFWSIWELPHDLENKPQVIKFSTFKDGRWTKAEKAPFTGKFRDGGPCFSPDGNRIYFYSRRPLNPDETEMNDNDIWFVERTANGWSQAQNAGSAINTEYTDAAPCIAANGNLYFTSNRNQYPDETGNNDLFMAEFKDGNYLQAQALSNRINTDYARESFSFIAPDESYLIFSRDSRKFVDGKMVSGDRRLMISFKSKEGEWMEAIDMGEQFYKSRFPSVSPDEKQLFFTKYSENSSEDFYRVDAKIIEELR